MDTLASGRKALVGFARRFRPTYASANMGGPREAGGEGLRYPTWRFVSGREQKSAFTASELRFSDVPYLKELRESAEAKRPVSKVVIGLRLIRPGIP